MTTEARKRLHDIRLAAEALCRFTDGKTVADLQRDEILQAALERKLEIIGEAFVQLRAEDAATAEKFPELRQIVGMRNRLVHGYDQLDLDVLWDATISHVPKLLEQVCGQGASRRRLVAHAAGGASIMDPKAIFDIGKRNYLALRKILWKAGILLAGEAVGGGNSRTVRLEIGSGRLWLQVGGGQKELVPSFPLKGGTTWPTGS